MLFDRDKNGYITFENLKQIAADLGKHLKILIICLGEKMSDDEIKEMLLEANQTNLYIIEYSNNCFRNGVVTKDQFREVLNAATHSMT